MADCCCDLGLQIERTAFATQIRDMENKCDTDKQLAGLACGQKEILGAMATNRLLDENQRLRDKVEVLREKDEKNLACCLASRTDTLVKELGDAFAQYAALATPTTLFPWNVPVNTVSCCCC